MSSVEGEWEEREKEGEVITAQFRLLRLRITSPKFVVAWTDIGARVVGFRMVGWFWSEMLRRASVFHPHPGGEQQLRPRRWQRNVTKTDLLFLRPPLQPELFSGRAVRACLDPRERATRSTRREE